MEKSENITHNFGLLDDLKLGVGIKNKISERLFFDLTYYQQVIENYSGFKGGVTQIGLIVEF